MILDYGGRHYLTKDVRISPETLRRGYGKTLDEFIEVKAKGIRISISVPCSPDG